MTIHSIKSLNKLITGECDYPPKGSFQTILYHIIRVYSRPWLVPYHLVPRCNYTTAVYYELYCRNVEFKFERLTSRSALFVVGRWKVPAATIYHWQTQLYRDKPREIGGQTNWNSDFSGVRLFIYLSGGLVISGNRKISFSILLAATFYQIVVCLTNKE